MQGASALVLRSCRGTDGVDQICAELDLRPVDDRQDEAAKGGAFVGGEVNNPGIKGGDQRHRRRTSVGASERETLAILWRVNRGWADKLAGAGGDDTVRRQAILGDIGQKACCSGGLKIVDYMKRAVEKKGQIDQRKVWRGAVEEFGSWCGERSFARFQRGDESIVVAEKAGIRVYGDAIAALKGSISSLGKRLGGGTFGCVFQGHGKAEAQIGRAGITGGLCRDLGGDCDQKTCGNAAEHGRRK